MNTLNNIEIASFVNSSLLDGIQDMDEIQINTLIKDGKIKTIDTFEYNKEQEYSLKTGIEVPTFIKKLDSGKLKELLKKGKVLYVEKRNPNYTLVGFKPLVSERQKMLMEAPIYSHLVSAYKKYPYTFKIPHPLKQNEYFIISFSFFHPLKAERCQETIKLLKNCLQKIKKLQTYQSFCYDEKEEDKTVNDDIEICFAQTIKTLKPIFTNDFTSK